jgi:hypothetical protein
MITFKTLEENTDIQKLIKETFDADLPLSGDWGYHKEKSTIIHTLPKGMTLPQLEHMITTIRVHLEMNITQEEANRYAGINVNEKSREFINHNNKNMYDKVSYEITAIKENLYHDFIKEYKAGYDNESLDLNAHFNRRKEATLTREVVHYFEVSCIKNKG